MGILTSDSFEYCSGKISGAMEGSYLVKITGINGTWHVQQLQLEQLSKSDLFSSGQQGQVL